MELQPDPPIPSRAESLLPPLRRIGDTRPDEPAVPVYRYLLFGEASRFQLTSTSKIGLAGVSSVGLPLGLTMAGRTMPPSAMIGLAISATSVSLLLAALVTRWAGRTSGMRAGWLALVGWTLASCCLAPNVMLAAAAAAAAILVHGLAEMPNRGEPIARTLAVVAFYLGATLSCLFVGLTAPAAIAVVCLGTVVGNGDSRGMRFFVSPAGLAVAILGLVIGILATAAAGPHEAAPWLGVSNSLRPQWPAAACVAVGMVLTWASVQTGHAASPLGHLLVSWLLGPALLAALGVVPVQLAAAVTLPAWAAMIGLAPSGLRRRRTKRPFWRLNFLGARARSA